MTTSTQSTNNSVGFLWRLSVHVAALVMVLQGVDAFRCSLSVPSKPPLVVANQKTCLQMGLRFETPSCRRDFIHASLLSAAATAFGWTKGASATEVQYSTANDIPTVLIDSHQYLFGYVERVIDGDTVRIRHIPDLGNWIIQNELQSSSSPSQRVRTSNLPIANSTIVVRMYGIDAPETAKKESETSQPFGENAKQLTKDMTYHKIVAVKLLRRDKYNRIVGEVDTFPGTASIIQPSKTTTSGGVKDMSVELASRGLAVLYTGAGAEYDGKLELLKQSIEEAQRSQIGIWSLGADFVTPQEYKRMKNMAERQ